MECCRGPPTTLKLMLTTRIESSAIGTIRIVTMDKRRVSKWEANQTGPVISQPGTTAVSIRKMTIRAGHPALHFCQSLLSCYTVFRAKIALTIQ